MTIEEKAKKFEEIQNFIWEKSKNESNVFLGAISKLLIKKLNIFGPNGENPNTVDKK